MRARQLVESLLRSLNSILEPVSRGRRRRRAAFAADTAAATASPIVLALPVDVARRPIDAAVRRRRPDAVPSRQMIYVSIGDYMPSLGVLLVAPLLVRRLRRLLRDERLALIRLCR